MKTFLKKIFLFIFPLLFTIPFFAKDFDSKQIMYINLDPAPLKEKASPVATQIGSLEYATQVFVLDTKKNWSKVKLVEDSSISGWIPASAVTRKKLKAKENSADANAEEIALAGKGFCSVVEAVYSEEYDVDYTVVNQMEMNSIDYEELRDFISEGKLRGIK